MMIKRILERFRRDRGLHKATVKIDFYPQGQVTPHIIWHRSQHPEQDTIPLVAFSYAHFLFELAELNEVRVARELIAFLEKVCKRVLTDSGPPGRPHLPLGQLRLVDDPEMPAVRTYQVEFFAMPGNNYRVEYRGSLGKEGFYLPGAFLALLQSCLDHLGDDPLRQLARALERLHAYYRLRRDFWDGGSLISGPAYALGKGDLREEENENV
ncbi:MAG: hypothetical protein M1438_00210 [Deltaproteobacteria bacterium]|nr:hypothetical protein [Deltaproteobacteria bacterium]